jgi:hypothetical protein
VFFTQGTRKAHENPATGTIEKDVESEDAEANGLTGRAKLSTRQRLFTAIPLSLRRSLQMNVVAQSDAAR